MKKALYSIFDKKALVYAPPTAMDNDDVAMRGVKAAMGPDTMIGTNAEDFSLNRVGSFNDATGEIEPQVPVVVCELLLLKGSNGKDS